MNYLRQLVLASFVLALGFSTRIDAESIMMIGPSDCRYKQEGYDFQSDIYLLNSFSKLTNPLRKKAIQAFHFREVSTLSDLFSQMVSDFENNPNDLNFQSTLETYLDLLDLRAATGNDWEIDENKKDVNKLLQIALSKKHSSSNGSFTLMLRLIEYIITPKHSLESFDNIGNYFSNVKIAEIQAVNEQSKVLRNRIKMREAILIARLYKNAIQKLASKGIELPAMYQDTISEPEGKRCTKREFAIVNAFVALGDLTTVAFQNDASKRRTHLNFLKDRLRRSLKTVALDTSPNLHNQIKTGLSLIYEICPLPEEAPDDLATIWIKECKVLKHQYGLTSK